MSRVFSRTNDAGSGRVFARTVDTGIATPVISSVSNANPKHGDSVVITLTGAGASQGAGGVTLGGVAQTITAWGDLSITFTCVRGVNKYGAPIGGVPLIVTRNDASASNPFTVTSIAPPTGWAYVDLITPNATASYRITAVADAVPGDQLAYESLGGLVTVFDDLTFQADVSVTDFDAMLWHTGDGYGATGTQSFDPQYADIDFTFGIDTGGGVPYIGAVVDWFIASSWGGIKIAGAITTLNATGDLVATVAVPAGTYILHYRLFGNTDFMMAQTLVLA